MQTPRTPANGEALLTSNGLFVVHLRSDSDLGRHHLCGRIEHVMSGQSEPFASLSNLLDFMARYPQPTPVVPGSTPAAANASASNKE